MKRYAIIDMHKTGDDMYTESYDAPSDAELDAAARNNDYSHPGHFGIADMDQIAKMLRIFAENAEDTA